MISFFYLILSASVVGMLAAWSSLILLWPALKKIGKASTEFSSGFWFGMGTLPAVIGLLAGVLALGSGLFSATGWITDHCSEHGGHPHLCVSHIGTNPPEGALFWSITTGIFALVLYVGFRGYRSSSRVNSSLRKSAVRQGSFYLFPSRIVAAFTAGLLSPKPFLSAGAEGQLGPEEKAVILAHEEEHIRRKDPLRLLILRFCERLFPGMSVARRRWEGMAELECDQAAVRAGFSAHLIAGTILKMQKANQPYRSLSGVLSYAGNDGSESLRIRIASLVSKPPQPVGTAPLLVLFAILLGISLGLFLEIHHALETVLGWLT